MHWYVLLFGIFMIKCQSNDHSISKLTLAIGGCAKVKKCPFMVIEMDQNGNYKHYCLIDCDGAGLFTSKVENSEWQKINIDLSAAKLTNIDHPFEFNRPDAYIEMLMVRKNDSILIKGHVSDLPGELERVISRMSLLRKRIKLVSDIRIENRVFDLSIPTYNYYTLPYPVDDNK